jgi:hypothetical protein
MDTSTNIDKIQKNDKKNIVYLSLYQKNDFEEKTDLI